MAQLNVNPEKVKELISRLNIHTNELQTKQKAIKAYLKGMEQFWNDNHYKAFNEQFAEFDKLVNNAVKLSETVLLPNLKNVQKFAEDYKNIGRK
jgi:uncharacterized protein YukE